MAGNPDAKLKRLVDQVLPDVVRLRHQLHRHPELAGGERQTATLIRRTLATAGAKALKPFLETDVVAILKGRKPGRHVALRADIDALPLAEKTGLPYASTVPGCMHACGHDGHTAILLGVARVLNGLRGEFDGQVRLVFQPGEEVAALGKDLVAAGALGRPGPDMVFALHGWTGMPLGAIKAMSGTIMAAAGFFKITIQGRGAHGSTPSKAIDPILTGARLVEALSALPREVSALDSAVVTVCRFTGGANGNVIPDTAEIEGTVRYFEPAVGRKVLARMRQVAQGVCWSMGASCRFEYREPYIPTVNAAVAVELGRDVTRRLLGRKAWQDGNRPSMGGEDFSYYLKKYPGAMFWLGLGEKGPDLHNPHFDFNDRALRNGMLLLAGCALEALKGKPKSGAQASLDG